MPASAFAQLMQAKGKQGTSIAGRVLLTHTATQQPCGLASCGTGRCSKSLCSST